MKSQYDLVVLSGTAGPIAALYTARAGAGAALGEHAQQPGGDRLFTAACSRGA